jgi:hypothetical protein
MAADVEAVAFVLDRSSQAADIGWVLLEDRDGDLVLQELIGGREPGRTGTHDHDVPALLLSGQSAHSVSTVTAGFRFGTRNRP